MGLKIRDAKKEDVVEMKAWSQLSGRVGVVCISVATAHDLYTCSLDKGPPEFSVAACWRESRDWRDTLVHADARQCHATPCQFATMPVPRYTMPIRGDTTKKKRALHWRRPE